MLTGVLGLKDGTKIFNAGLRAFSEINWNIPKIYSVLILSEILTATIFIFRFRSKRWMTNLVGG